MPIVAVLAVLYTSIETGIAVWATAAGHGSTLLLALMIGFGRFLPPPAGWGGLAYWIVWSVFLSIPLGVTRLLALCMAIAYDILAIVVWASCVRDGDLRYLGGIGLLGLGLWILWQWYVWSILLKRRMPPPTHIR